MFEPEALLHEFYSAYLAWVEVGAPENTRLKPFYGLCTNLDLYFKNQPNTTKFKDNPYQIIILKELMAYQFEQADLCFIYPFGKSAYHKHFSNHTLHLDPNRLTWVRDRVARKPITPFKVTNYA